MSILDALIDSGATDNFLSPIVVKYFNLPTKELDKPKTIRNVDGTKNTIGNVTQTVDLTLKFIKNKRQEIIRVQTFYIADLESDYMLLGMPFLSANNPIIDWTAKQLKGTIEARALNAYRLPQQAETPEQLKQSLKDQADIDTMANYINPEPEDDLVVRHTAKSTTLAAEAVDKTKHTW